MDIAFWPSRLNPAVRLVLFGIGFTLGGLTIAAVEWRDRRERRQAGAEYGTSFDRFRVTAGRVVVAAFLAAGLASVAIGIAELAE